MRFFSLGLLPFITSLSWLGSIVDAAGVLEIDVIFPRNETYAPTRWFPVVYAIRNAQLAQYLRPTIQTTVRTMGKNWTVLSEDHHEEMQWANWSSHEPYFVYDFVNLEEEERPLELFWMAHWLSCGPNSSVDNPYLTPTFINNSTEPSQRAIRFTMEKGGKAVNLVAATADGDKMCAQQPGTAINVTDETRYVPPQEENKLGNATCVVVASSTPTPTPDPCQVKIDSAIAASITASLTAARCFFNDPTFDCPKKNVAERLAITGMACLAAAVGAVGFWMA